MPGLFQNQMLKNKKKIIFSLIKAENFQLEVPNKV